MTEAEWLASDDRDALQNFLQHHPQAPRYRNLERRLKLFTCGCCRLLWDVFQADIYRHAVVVAEDYADGEVGSNALARAHLAVQGLPVPAGAGSVMVEIGEDVDEGDTVTLGGWVRVLEHEPVVVNGVFVPGWAEIRMEE